MLAALTTELSSSIQAPKSIDWLFLAVGKICLTFDETIEIGIDDWQVAMLIPLPPARYANESDLHDSAGGQQEWWDAIGLNANLAWMFGINDKSDMFN